MSAAVNDRPHGPFSLPATPHLPLTGELHPLRREFEKWLATGNAITLLFALLVVSLLMVWDRTHVALPPVIHGPFVVDPHEWSPPPIVPRPGGSPGGINVVIPKNAVPDPVDQPIDENATIPTQEDLTGGWDAGLESPLTTLDPGDIPVSSVPPRPEFVPFDEPPVLLAIEPPVYPEMVRDAGIDGTVNIMVLVGRNGRVKEAIVQDGSPALHAAALASARTAVFKPALQGVQPVEVWVQIPVEFRLQGAR